MTPPRTALAIRRELARVEQIRDARATTLSEREWAELVGAVQALAWVLRENAAAPSRCVSPAKPPAR